MAQHDSEIAVLIAAGRKIEAMRLYRERYGVGLKEAKDAVDAIERGETSPLAPSPPGSGLADDPGLASIIDPLVRNGQLIQAIQQYRRHRPVGLKEAKEIIEARAAELGPTVGSTQPAKGFLNCSTVILLVVALGWLIYHAAVGW